MPVADFCCGAECGITTGGATPSPDGNRHWRTFVGPITAQATFARNGGQAYRFKPIGTVGEVCLLRFDPNPTTGTTRWARGYVYFNAFPSVDADIISVFTAAAKSYKIRYLQASQQLVARADGTNGATTVGVSLGVWYRIDIKVDVSGATSTITWQIDGVDKGSATTTTAASTITQFLIGAQVSGGTALTADVMWDDVITGTNLAEYPVGAGKIVGLMPSADGSHSFDTAGQFVYNAAGGNIDPAATDTYTYINHQMGTIGNFLTAATALTAQYLEHEYDNLGTDVSTINGVEVVSAHHATDGNANKASIHLMDGATEAVVVDDGDFSQITLVYNSTHFAAAPSTGDPWLKSGVDAIKTRWGSSWTATDVTPDAYLDGIMLEVDYVVATNSTGSGSPVKTVSKTATGTAVQKFNASGSPLKTVSKTASGTATQIFSGTGSPMKTVSKTAAGTASQKFNASGSPVKTVSKFASGVANSTGNIFGSGSPVKTVSKFASGVATSTVIYPDPAPTGIGGNGRFIVVHTDDTPAKRKKKHRPRLMPEIVIEAQEAPVTPLEPLQAITRRQVNPETWQKIQTAVRVQEILAKAQATHEPIGDVDLRLLRHFLEMVGKGPELTEDEANMPFMLKRFLRMGK